MPESIILAIDYGSSFTKAVVLSADNLELAVKRNGVVASNGQDTMSSVVRIQKGSCFGPSTTRAQSLGQQTGRPVYQYQTPVAKLGEARGVNDIAIRYSKRDIGRQFIDVDARALSQQYGGLKLVPDDKGYMAFNLTEHMKEGYFAMTPVDIMRECILKQIFRQVNRKPGMYIISHLVLTVPVSATEHIKELYEAAAKEAIQDFPKLLPVDGVEHKMPEIHIIPEPVAGLCYRLLEYPAGASCSAAAAAGNAGELQEAADDTPVLYLGVDVGDGTTDCCVSLLHPASRTFEVIGSYGNSHLGAADVKHQLLNMVADGLMKELMPEESVEEYGDAIWRSVALATEELSGDGDLNEVWNDYGNATDGYDRQIWLAEHLHITRRLVHQAAAIFTPAMKESLMNVLEVAGKSAADINKVVLMGGGSELPCVRQALRAVLGAGVLTKVFETEGGNSTHIAYGAANYVRHLLLDRNKQQQQPQGVGVHATVSMPVGMHICTKVTYRSRALHPKTPDPNWPVSVARLIHFRRLLANTDLNRRAKDAQMLDQVIAYYKAQDEGRPHHQLPPLPPGLGTESTNFELYWPLIGCKEMTPTEPKTLPYQPPTSKQLTFNIHLYAADPLYKNFVYMGGRQVEVKSTSDQVQGKAWVDDKQRLRCSATLQRDEGEELQIKTTFDKEAVQRSNQLKRRAELSAAAGDILRRLSYWSKPAARGASSRGVQAVPMTTAAAAATVAANPFIKPRASGAHSSAAAAAAAAAACTLPASQSELPKAEDIFIDAKPRDHGGQKQQHVAGEQQQQQLQHAAAYAGSTPVRPVGKQQLPSVNKGSAQARQQRPSQAAARQTNRDVIAARDQHTASAEPGVPTSSQSAAEALCRLSRSSPAKTQLTKKHSTKQGLAPSAAAAGGLRTRRSMPASTAAVADRKGTQRHSDLRDRERTTSQARGKRPRPGTPEVPDESSSGVEHTAKRNAVSAADSDCIIVADSEDETSAPAAVASRACWRSGKHVRS